MASQNHSHDEITMDEDFAGKIEADTNAVLSTDGENSNVTDAADVLGEENDNEDVVAVVEQIKAKYANMTANELQEIVEIDTMLADDSVAETELEDELALFPAELLMLLPPLDSTAGQAPEAIRVPIKIHLDKMALYLYEYDGEDTARAYYTCQFGSILGSTLVSLEGLDTIRFKAEFHWEQERFKRDLAWNTATTLQEMQAQDMFASEAYIKAEKEEIKAILAARASAEQTNITATVTADTPDEDVF